MRNTHNRLAPAASVLAARQFAACQRVSLWRVLYAQNANLILTRPGQTTSAPKGDAG
jgi:hypothetical protein